MIRTFAKQLASTVLSFLLVVVTTPVDARAQQPATTGSPGSSEQGAPLSAEELQQMTAPIALYPDALVAQILGAATFPDQVAFAANWLHQNSSLTGKALMQAVDQQTWDPSVKALTQFPSVLDDLAKNLSWTSALGEAYHTQPADVMSAIQFLRAKAQAAGNLKSGSQIVVKQESPQTIVIQSANPQLVYVPTYNPAVVYGYPYVVPGYVYVPPPAGAAVVAFGVGVAVGAMMSSGYGWGYSSWNCGWHSTTVVYRGGSYYGNSAWHGGYYGSTVPLSGTIVPVITHPRGRMPVVARSRTATVARALVKRTTQGPGRPPRLCKGPMPMGAMEPRRFRKTATPPTASIKRPLKERLVRCTLQTAARLMARQVSTAIALP